MHSLALRNLLWNLYWLLPALGLLAWDRAAPADAPKYVALGIAALLGALIALSKRAPLRGSAGLWGFSAWVLWYWLSIAWGSPRALGYGAGLFASCALAWCCAGIFSFAEIKRALYRAALFCGIVLSLWVSWQFFSGARGVGLHAGQGNPNWLGLCLAICLVLGAGDDAELARRSGLRRVLPRLVVQFVAWGLVFWALYLADSIVAWVASSVSGILLMLAWRAPLRAYTGLVLTAALLPIFLSWERMPSGDWLGLGAALDGRRLIWSRGLELWLEAPWGLGAGAFSGRFLDAQGEYLAGLELREAARLFHYPRTAHSDWMQSLTEQGLVGFGLLAFWIIACVRGLKGFRPGQVALIALAFCAAGDDPLRLPLVLFFMALLVAASARGAFREPRRFGVKPWIAFALLCGWLLKLPLGYWAAGRAIHASREAPEQRLELIRRAVIYDNYSAETNLMLAAALFAEGQLEEALVQAQRSLTLSPTLAGHLLKAQALARLGRDSEALSCLKLALRLNPGSFRAQLFLSALYLRLGELDEAERHHTQAKRVLPGDARLEPLAVEIRKARQQLELR